MALTEDLIVRLLMAMVAVSHGPARFTDDELAAAYQAWNELLRKAPEFHMQVPAFFSFHQALLVERDARADLPDLEVQQ